MQDDTVSALVRSLDAIASRLESLQSRLGDKSCEVSGQKHVVSQETVRKSTLDPTFRGKCFECGQIGHRKFECPLKDQPERQKATVLQTVR